MPTALALVAPEASPDDGPTAPLAGSSPDVPRPASFPDDRPAPSRPDNQLAAQLADVRHLVVVAIISRGFPSQDAEDVAHDVLVKIAGDWNRFATLLDDLDEHGSYFIKMAYNTYRMRLRSERRRQRREEFHSKSAISNRAGGDGYASDGPGVADALELASAAPLSRLQRRYLQEVLVEHRSVEQIASERGTTPRAVRGVLQRGAAVVREQHRRACVAA